MPFIKFGELLPDLPAYKNPGCLQANNVISYGDGYKPFNTLATFSNALDNRAQGLANLVSTDGTRKTFAGDSSKLYELDNATFSDVSKSGGYTVSQFDKWSITIFGNTVIAAALGQNIQKFEIGTDTEFSDLTSLSTKFVTVVRDFLVTGHNSSQTQRVRWSALNDPTDFTVSQATQSDFQDLVGDHGPVTGLNGGEFLTVFMQNAIFRGDYVGTPLIFQFTKVNNTHGAIQSGSISTLGHLSFYLSEDGFYMFDGRVSKPIGANKINKFFFDDYNLAYADRISSAIDPVNNLIIWAYASNVSGGVLDKLIMYNYTTQRWTTADVSLQILGQSQTPGFTLEQLDDINSSIDALDVSFDSPIWAAGRIQLSAFNNDKKLGVFSNTPDTSSFTTTELDAEGRRSVIRSVRPIIDGGTVTVQVGSRPKQGDDVVFNSAVSLNDSGEAPMRQTNRYHRIKTNITGEFTNSYGVDVEFVQEGKR
jgi:hypothetical protein